MGPRSILITGGNRGLGLAAAEQLARAGHRIILAVRDPAAGKRAAARLAAVSANGEPRVESLDLASFASTRACGLRLVEAGEAIEVVLHNAGILMAGPRSVTGDGLERLLQVHAVAPLLLTHVLEPVLARPCRTVWVGSSLHKPGMRGAEVDFRFEDPNLQRNYDPQRAYKNSKLAQLWIARELERRWGPEGIHADAVCPGFVPRTVAANASGMQRLMLRYVLPLMPFATSVASGARELTRLCEGPFDGPGGRYVKNGAAQSPSPDAMDDDKAARFWKLACRWADIPL